MQRMTIITADNETAELLSLRFELEGFAVERIHPAKHAASERPARKPAICIIDVESMKPEELEEAQSTVRKFRLGALDAVLLMQDVPEGKRYQTLHRHIIMRKPYDLTSLAHMVSKLIAQRARNKKPRSSKR